MATETSAQDLAARLLADREKRLASQARVYRQDHPRASGITECDREIFYSIVNWQQKPPPDPWLLARFEMGRNEEQLVIKELIDLGYEVNEAQRPFEIKDRDGVLICTGHIDGVLQKNETSTVFEVKSLNPNIWRQIDSAEDFNKYTWARRYPRQLLLYLYAYGEAEGLFVITDCLGHWKAFTLSLVDHLDECERILQRCRNVVDAVKAGTPERLDYCVDPGVCLNCWAYKAGLCQPPMDFTTQGLQAADDAEIVEALDRLGQIEEAAKEYAALEKRVKEHFKKFGTSRHLAGQWYIEVQERTRTAYNVPAEIKQKYASKATSTYVKWKRIEA